jgi:hypothetical protein
MMCVSVTGSKKKKNYNIIFSQTNMLEYCFICETYRVNLRNSVTCLMSWHDILNCSTVRFCSSIHWAQGAVFSGINEPEPETITRVHLVPSLRKGGLSKIPWSLDALWDYVIDNGFRLCLKVLYHTKHFNQDADIYWNRVHLMRNTSKKPAWK